MTMPTGCIIDRNATEAFRADLGKPFAYQAKPSIKGRWQALVKSGVSGVFLWEAERKLTGAVAAADSQARGTCTSRGMYKAALRSMTWDIVAGAMVGKFVRPAFAPIYVGARILRGYGRAVPYGQSCRNCGDGTVVADAAKWVHDVGINTINDLDGFQNEKTAEAWAINNGHKDFKFPDSLKAIAHKCRAMETQDDRELADTVAAGNAAALGSTRYASPSASRGAGGIIEKTPSGGGHCECISGVYLTGWPKDANDLDELMSLTNFVTDGSWRPWPLGSDMLATAEGPVRLPSGSYASTGKNVRQAIKDGECWAVDVKEGWT